MLELSASSASQKEQKEDRNKFEVKYYFDIDYYLGQNPDILGSGIDPLDHYNRFGWKEGRRPNPGFDPTWYLQAYADIRAAGVEPFAHYIQAGRLEGRSPTRPAEAPRAAIAKVHPDFNEVPKETPSKDDQIIPVHELRSTLRDLALTSFGFVLSVSHDRYIDVTGGVQLVVADEQALFASARFSYLHVSPAMARLTLVADNFEPHLLQLVLDGRFIGLVDAATLREALAAEAPTLPEKRIFVVHSFFGHRPSDLIAWSAAISAKQRLFWLHDYGAVCQGFNLLRNGIAACGAPQPESTACRICVYGSDRVTYQRAVQRLFSALRPILVAPSASALATFRAGSNLPSFDAVIHPNAALTADEPVPTPRPAIGTSADPIRIAFVGYPLPHKGWIDFQNLFDALIDDPRYACYHFAAQASLVPCRGLTCIPARATSENRHAMVQALRNHAIDLVLMLAPWPETFSFVTYEAIAAGADVITYEASGNAAAAVRRYGRGVVLSDEAALLRFFTSGTAVAYMRQVAAKGRIGGSMRLIGTTATLNPAAQTPPRLDLETTTEHHLTVLAGNRHMSAKPAGPRVIFALPEGTETVRLLSRRTLDGIGVRIARMLLDGRLVALETLQAEDGWLQADSLGRPTNGDARLETAGARQLEITLVPGVAYPKLPMAEI